MTANAQEKMSLNNVGNGEAPAFHANPILTIKAEPVKSPIKIDGVLDDAWTLTPSFSNFVENWPNNGQPPKVRTEGHITFDNEFLYIAFVCYDDNIKNLRYHLSDRDAIYQDDFVGINIDAYGTRQNSYEYFVNPLGIQADLAVTQNGGDNNEDDSYDALWYSDAKIYDDHWTVEMKIPFKSLRFPDTEQQEWLIHVLRIYPRDSRYVYSWMNIPQGSNNSFTYAGKLHIKKPATESSNLEILPYVAASGDKTLDENTAGNGRWSSTDYGSDIGFNLKYGLSSTITLDLAYNPDFSQIEADATQVSVNNSFALFYREKRPFFLEASDIFSSNGDVNLLYTRTINDPLVAAKLSGKAGKLSFGIIQAYDEASAFTTPLEEQSQITTTSTPSWNTIARSKYDLGGGSYLGFIGTDRRFSGRAHNTVLSLDGQFRWNENLTLQALYGYADTRELDKASINPDDSLVFRAGGQRHDTYFNGESFSGTVARATLERNGKSWNLFSWVTDVSPGFRSDNGFINKNNYREVGLWSGYNFWMSPSHPFLNRIQPQVQGNRKYNYDGQLKDFWIAPALNIQFRYQTGTFFRVAAINNEHFGGRQFDNLHRASWEVWTNASKYFSAGFWTEYGYYINRGGSSSDIFNPLAKIKGFQFNTYLTLRPLSNLINEFNYSSASFWNPGSKTISAQRVYRDQIQFQFTRQLFLRLIGEVNDVTSYFARTDDNGDYVTDGLGQQIRDKDHYLAFTFSPLLSFKVNPFTVFFIGANFGGQKDPYPNRDGYSATSQNVFVKFQYFVRI